MLDDVQLGKVAGGSRRGDSMKIVVEVPELATNDIKVLPYLDGELLTSMVKVIDSCVREVTFSLSSSGIKQFRVKFNNVIKDYEINFDDGTYFQK